MTDLENEIPFTLDQQMEQVSASGQNAHKNPFYPIMISPLAVDQFDFEVSVLQPSLQPANATRYVTTPGTKGKLHQCPVGEPQWVLQTFAATEHSSTPPISDSSIEGGLDQPPQQVRDSFTSGVRNQAVRQMALMPPAYRKPDVSGPVPLQLNIQRTNSTIQGTEQSEPPGHARVSLDMSMIRAPNDQEMLAHQIKPRRESVKMSSSQPINTSHDGSACRTTPAAQELQRTSNDFPGLSCMQAALAQGTAFGTPVHHSSDTNTNMSKTRPKSTLKPDNVPESQNEMSLQEHEYACAVLLTQYRRRVAGPLDLLAAENHHAIPGSIPSPEDLENALAHWSKTLHILDQRGKLLKQRLLCISLPNHREIDRKMVNTGLEALHPFIEGEKGKTTRWRDVLEMMKSRVGTPERQKWVASQLKEAEKHFEGRMSQLEDIQSALNVSAHCVLRLEQMQEDYRDFGRYRGVAGG